MWSKDVNLGPFLTDNPHPTGADHKWTDWEFRRHSDDALIWASEWDTTNLLGITTPAVFEDGEDYYYIAIFGDQMNWPSPPLIVEFSQFDGALCSLLLEVYEDDRESVLWEASTDPAHPFPYLCDPEHYEEQEIDITTGSARIGTVGVTLIDRAQEAGNQQSGWMTERVADIIHGRRARLTRFADTGPVRIVDGPAGPPQLHSSYAGFSFHISDTRETERHIRAFAESDSTSVWPRGVGVPFAGAVGPIIEPVITAVYRHLFALGREIDFSAHWAGDPTVGGPHEVDPQVVVTPEFEAMLLSTVTGPDQFGIYGHTWPQLKPLWRVVGNTAYTVGQFGLATVLNPAPTALATVYDALVNGEPVRAIYTIDVGLGLFGEPADLDDIEIRIHGVGPTSTLLPMHITGPAGEVLKDIYDGIYSPRDSNGDVIPTGVRYDAAALALMTDEVSLRVTEPWTDARAEAEKAIYAPTGWVPALNNDGEISPISQVPPSFVGVTDIDDSITEPVPTWSAGERIVNRMAFRYQRYYVPFPNTDTPHGDGLLPFTVELEAIDALSILRHGEQLLEYDATAFSAVGTSSRMPTGSPPESESVAIQNETGWQLFQLRQLYVFDRFRRGAQGMVLPVLRSATSSLRAGSWVTASISWFPNYDTGQRGQDRMKGQIIGIRDLDCVRRELLIEEAVETFVS